MDQDILIKLLDDICTCSKIIELYNISKKINIVLEKNDFYELKCELLYKILSNKEFITPFSNVFYYINDIYIPKLNSENKNVFSHIYYNLMDIYDDKWNRWSNSTKNCE